MTRKHRFADWVACDVSWMSDFDEREVLFARGISNNKLTQHANDKWIMTIESTLNAGNIQVASLYPKRAKEYEDE